MAVNYRRVDNFACASGLKLHLDFRLEWRNFLGGERGVNWLLGEKKKVHFVPLNACVNEAKRFQ